MAKCVLTLAGHEAKAACGAQQLCCGLEAGIEGAVHALNTKRKEKNEEDDWGIPGTYINSGICTSQYFSKPFVVHYFIFYVLGLHKMHPGTKFTGCNYSITGLVMKVSVNESTMAPP